MLVGVRRVLINGLAALSAVLFVAVSVMWMRSYYRWDSGLCRFGPFMVVAGSALGSGEVGVAIRLTGQRWSFDGERYASDVVYKMPASSRKINLSVKTDGGFEARIYLAVPYWFLLILFSITPLIRWRMGRRVVAAGVCRQCGYDLRATPERCPECGAVVGGTKARA